MPKEDGYFKKGNVGRPKKSYEQMEFERKGRKWLHDVGIAKILEIAGSGVKSDYKWAIDKLTDICFMAPVREQYLDANLSDGLDASVGEVRSKIAVLIGGATVGSAGSGQTVESLAEPSGDKVV